MKKFKMLIMAVVTTISGSIFAKVAPNNQARFTKQNLGKWAYTCLIHHDMVIDNLGACQYFSTSLNLSSKEKMKREAVKIDDGSKNNMGSSERQCILSKDAPALNLSPKEKMKWEVMKI